MRDEEIISLVLKGRTELYSDIVDRYSYKVYSTAYNYTHDQEDAKDLTQEIFIKVYNSLYGFKSKSSFSTWLYRIAVNKCIDWTRKRKIPTISAYYDDQGEETDIFASIPDNTYSPEEELLNAENKEIIKQAVSELPEMYKTVLILYYFEDFSPQEISDIIDAPKKTVETRLFRAKNMIKSKLRYRLYGGECYGLQQV